MPLIQAYKCPRTRKIIEDKTKYIAHLKTRSLQYLYEGSDHPRLQLLARKVTEARKSVRSVEEFIDWLMRHQRILVHLSVAVRSLHYKLGKTVNELEAARFDAILHNPSCSNKNARPIHGVWQNYNDTRVPTSYPGLTCEFIHEATTGLDVPKILERFAAIATSGFAWRGDEYIVNCMFFAEDWPCVGAQHLFYRRNLDLEEEHIRILKYAFPGIDIEHYCQLSSAGLLPDDIESFKDFLFQYIEIKPEPAVYPGVDLPADL